MGAPAVGYVQPERLCGRCGRIDEIACRAVGDAPDICVNCYRLPLATCGSCGRRRPCNYVADGNPMCQRCQPRAVAVCAHCAQSRPPCAHWAEGPVCAGCYDAALRRRGACAGCGQDRRLVAPPGPGATRCCSCAGLAAMHACSSCGREDKLFERGRCARCALARRAGALMAGPDGGVPATLAGVHDAIVASASPHKALNWLRTGAGAPILGDLAAGTLALSHEALDAHPRPRAAGYVRQMLVAHGALPERDEALAGLERWVDAAVAGIDRAEDRKEVRAFATWCTLRGIRRRASRTEPNRRTATAYARNQVSAAIALLDWLADHSLTLAGCRQADVDRWCATGPASRRDARHFLSWTAGRGLTPKLVVPVVAERDGDALGAEERWTIARRLLHEPGLGLVDRVAGSFVLLYAQTLSTVAVMTKDQVSATDGVVTVRFARNDVEIAHPLGGLISTLAATGRRDHVGIAAPTTTPWLFPGHLPGRPITASRLGARLGVLGIDARAARRAALIQLAAELPAPVLADSLGITDTTAADWVKAAGGDWAGYAGTIAESG